MGNEFSYRSSEIALPNRNDPIETFFFDGPYEPLRVCIRVRGLIRSLHL